MENRNIKNIILLFTLGFFFFLLWMIYLANMGSQNILFELSDKVPYGDKICHLTLFGTLAFGTSLVLDFKAFIFKKIKLYYGVVYVFFFSFIEEFTQAYFPNRTLDIYDLVADITGLILCTIVLLFLENKINKKDRYVID